MYVCIRCIYYIYTYIEVYVYSTILLSHTRSSPLLGTGLAHKRAIRGGVIPGISHIACTCCASRSRIVRVRRAICTIIETNNVFEFSYRTRTAGKKIGSRVSHNAAAKKQESVCAIFHLLCLEATQARYITCMHAYVHT